MKPLTEIAKSIIENAVWDTYGVSGEDMEWSVTSSNARTAYLEEKGISTKYTGKNLCVANGSEDYCNDSVERTTTWTGLVGLMSVSDIEYANGWLYDQLSFSYPWTISSGAGSSDASVVWYLGDANYQCAYSVSRVFSSVYLNSNIKIISGNGDTEPYILGL